MGIVVVHEFPGRGAGLGCVVIFAGSAFIGSQGPGGELDMLGGALIIAACVGWAIDNNLTQKLSIHDPFQIVAVKTGVAAGVNIGLALARGEALPGGGVLAGALALARRHTGSASCSTPTRCALSAQLERLPCSRRHRSQVCCSQSHSSRNDGPPVTFSQQSPWRRESRCSSAPGTTMSMSMSRLRTITGTCTTSTIGTSIRMESVRQSRTAIPLVMNRWRMSIRM